MKTNERFLKALRYMNSKMKEDIADGHYWTYCNKSSKKAKSFEAARKQGKYKINCVDGVQWALQIAGVNATSWYGGDSEIVWCSANAKAKVKKYFDIIETGGKTVQQLYNSKKLCDGDILLGYQGFAHTNCYFGGTKSFDSGHAFCTGSGEGAVFKKWIGSLRYKHNKVNYILRLKDRAHYRVQAGAYTNITTYNEQAKIIEKAGFKTKQIFEDNMYKIQVGYFSGKTNAQRLIEELKEKDISAFIKEIE